MEAALAPAPRWLLPTALALMVTFFAVRNLPWHLDDYDQAKQAYVSFEMLREGAWGFQHTPSGRIATKPPLAGWLSAGLANVTGSWELAWRGPPLAAALLILWLLIRAGREIGGSWGALLAASAFGFNLMTPRLATLVRTDMLLSLTIFLIGYLIWQRLRLEQPWRTRDRWQLFGLLLASMLIKGPIAYAFLFPGLAAFWWLRRRRSWPASAWSGWWSWLGPLACFAIWAGLGIWLSREFYEQVVLDEFLGRFTVGEAARHHNQPLYFYLTNLLHRFFPWSLLLLGLMACREVRAKLRLDPSLCWLLCWSIGGLLFMSLVPSKRADRIFPLVPPLCLLCAGLIPLLPRPVHDSWWSRQWLPVLTWIGIACSGSYTVYRVIVGYRTHQGALADFGREVLQVTSGRKLAIVSGKDEGMLLYLQSSHFTKWDQAVSGWQAGNIEAVVLPQAAWQRKKEDWPSAGVVLHSTPAPEKANAYVLLRPESTSSADQR